MNKKIYKELVKQHNKVMEEPIKPGHCAITLDLQNTEFYKLALRAEYSDMSFNDIVTQLLEEAIYVL
jgi:hypothetical protein